MINYNKLARQLKIIRMSSSERKTPYAVQLLKNDKEGTKANLRVSKGLHHNETCKHNEQKPTMASKLTYVASGNTPHAKHVVFGRYGKVANLEE